MKRWLRGQTVDYEDVVTRIFQRPELIPAARNPFMADLITHYLMHNNGALPPNQFEVLKER